MARGICPVHDVYDNWTCGGDCAEARKEFKKIEHAFRTYWFQRAREINFRTRTRQRFTDRLWRVRRMFAA